MLWKAEGSSRNGKASGAGRSRGVGRGSQGKTVLTASRMMTFSIITYVCCFILRCRKIFSDKL